MPQVRRSDRPVAKAVDRPRRPAVPIERLEVSVYRVPTDFAESDGTFAWDATTLVVVQLTAANHAGLGYTYASASTGALIQEVLREPILHSDAMAVPANWEKMVRAIRNLGRPGIC